MKKRISHRLTIDFVSRYYYTQQYIPSVASVVDWQQLFRMISTATVSIIDPIPRKPQKRLYAEHAQPKDLFS